MGDDVIGESGELASNRREEQELSVLCLQILQSIETTNLSPTWVSRSTDITGHPTPDRMSSCCGTVQAVPLTVSAGTQTCLAVPADERLRSLNARSMPYAVGLTLSCSERYFSRRQVVTS